MSTRCQVSVHEMSAGGGEDDRVTLYHHTDGYPEYMVPLIVSAWRKAIEEKGSEWRAGRAGKAASFLCYVDPGTMEPEAGHELHGDIEFYYRVRLTGSKAVGKPAPRWSVEVLVPDGSVNWTDWKRTPTEADIRTLLPATDAEDLEAQTEAQLVAIRDSKYADR